MSRLHQQLGISQGVALLATSLLGTGIFVVPAIAASIAERSSLLAWAILIALVLPIAFTFAALGKRYPHAGGAAHFVGKALGPRAEKLTAFLFLSVLPVGLPAALVMATGFWQAVFELSPIMSLGIQLFTLLCMLLLGLGGAKLSANVQAIIALAIVTLVAALWWQADIVSSDYQLPSDLGSPNIVPALAVMFWCFVGIEAFAHMGEEFRRPERDFPIALLLGVFVAGAVYWAASVVVLKFGAYGTQHANTQSLPHVVALLFGPHAKWLAAIVGYLACFASMNIYIQGFARLLWSMADEGHLPKQLAHLSTNKVPTRALITIVSACVISCVVAWLFKLPLDELIRYANGNFIVVYLLSMIAGAVLLKGVFRILAITGAALCCLLLLALGQQSIYVLLLSIIFLLIQPLFMQIKKQWKVSKLPKG
ncbi:L-methionine/branched-chain amino acid transporter [Agarivorans sp. 1_MG-2023]|uniref:L-methionine/branched-chain amino acid transporter n=1 Tax=Agarivorans sp. 1_MG-2023 TaxID=3062634 RepID=UPI0026E48349|nr:L-methionine/branched-chain amino acid transporter [Agarivorans sp. 1_MG-2023]MDO6764976.1 L-methionine/branched-chain amino acid transporter [Agarivorans sp. 1_MG-2023]